MKILSENPSQDERACLGLVNEPGSSDRDEHVP